MGLISSPSAAARDTDRASFACSIFGAACFAGSAIGWALDGRPWSALSGCLLAAVLVATAIMQRRSRIRVAAIEAAARDVLSEAEESVDLLRQQRDGMRDAIAELLTLKEVSAEHSRRVASARSGATPGLGARAGQARLGDAGGRLQRQRVRRGRAGR